MSGATAVRPTSVRWSAFSAGPVMRHWRSFVAIGVIAALASTRLLGTLLYEVKAVDPLVFVSMSLTMVGIGVLASYMPARRASNVDPIEALRSD